MAAMLLKTLKYYQLPSTLAKTFTRNIFYSHVSHSSQNGSFSFALMFDIDGVLVRGKKVFPASLEAFRMLVDNEGNFRIPTVFVTNAGNSLRCQKAEKLSGQLGVKISEDQVIMAHSPLKMFKQFHSKHVLVSGQGPLLEIAKNLGFRKISTIEDIRQAFPVLDAVNQQRREQMSNQIDTQFQPIEAIALLQEPAEWETALQFIIDTLITNGKLLEPPQEIPYPHIPLLACNMDLQWMAEAWMPRFGHGAFLLCLESLYKKITGKELIYTALIGKPSELTMHHADQMAQQHAKTIGKSNAVKRIYFIGDNLDTDIFGANLYHRYLKRKRPGLSLAAAVTGRGLPAANPVDLSDETYACAEECYSILVQTGVAMATTANGLNHSPRDFLPVEESMREPAFYAKDVLQAVQLVFEREQFN